ncbi:unnamed protein product [Arctogadus glacialis]
MEKTHTDPAQSSSPWGQPLWGDSRVRCLGYSPGPSQGCLSLRCWPAPPCPPSVQLHGVISNRGFITPPHLKQGVSKQSPFLALSSDSWNTVPTNPWVLISITLPAVLDFITHNPSNNCWYFGKTWIYAVNLCVL